MSSDPKAPPAAPPAPPKPIERQLVKGPSDPELERALQELRASPPPAPDRLPRLMVPPEAVRLARLEAVIRDVRTRLMAAEAILGEALREG